MSRWRLALWLTAGAGYALVSHWLMLHAAHAPWAVVVLLGPLVLAGAGYAMQQHKLLGLLGFAAGSAALAWVVAEGGLGSVNLLYLLQHMGIHLALGVSFALTLRAGHVPLITRLALRLHGTLDAAHRRYTRQVTLAWCFYFFGMATLSLAFYAWAPWAAWSLLANVATPLAMATLFVGEYLLRFRLHPEFERKPLADMVKAWRHS